MRVAVESLSDRQLGRVRLRLAEIARSSNLVGLAMDVIEEGSTIKTDGATNLKRLAGMGYQHEPFVGVDGKVPAHVNMPGVHMVGSLLKRWLTRTLLRSTSTALQSCGHLSILADASIEQSGPVLSAASLMSPLATDQTVTIGLT